LAYDFRASADRTILKCLHPKSKTLTKEQKERLKSLLKKNNSQVWERNKNRLRIEREKRKIREEDNQT